MADGDAPVIIIKRIKKVSGGGHHGGAWKVAYADFVTAMMAFFMLLWLLNVTEKEVLEGLADYFAPTLASYSESSAGDGMFGGESIMTDGKQASGSTLVAIPAPPPDDAAEEDGAEDASSKDDFDSKIASFDDPRLTAAEEDLKQVIQKSPELQDHTDQMIIEQTPDGMRIQLVDKDNRPMFREGSADFYGYATKMIEEVGSVIEDLPNRIAILGHTDAIGQDSNADYTNWELSADRANAARRVLRRSGATADRFSEVTGKAHTEPMFPDDPRRPENRRITILILREAPVLSPEFEHQ